MYHDVVWGDPDASGLPGPLAARYKLSWPDFRAHLDAIGRAVGRPPDLVDTPLLGRRTWSLTFDDGGASMLEVGEELARRGWRAHFFVATAFVGQAAFVDGDGLRELRRMQHSVGSHSTTHPERMSSLADEQLLEEWRTSVEALSELLGEPVRTASVPGGFYAKRVGLAAQRAGIAVLCTSEPVRTPHRLDGCVVVGRLSVRRATSAHEVALAAAGARGPWLRQYVGWNTRKPVKRVLGSRYERLRTALDPVLGRGGSRS